MLSPAALLKYYMQRLHALQLLSSHDAFIGMCGMDRVGLGMLKGMLGPKFSSHASLFAAGVPLNPPSMEGQGLTHG